MGFGGLIKAGFNVLTVPVAIVKDVVTMGGVVVGKPQSYTKDKVDQIADDIDEITK